MKTPKILAAAFLVVFLAACSDDNNPGGSEGESAMTEIRGEFSGEELQALERSSQFDVDFFNAAMRLEDEANIAVSPLSAKMTLAMLANALDDESRAEITSKLGCGDMASLNGAIGRYIELFPKIDSKVAGAIANSAWYSKRLNLSSGFSEVMGSNYGGACFPLDFSRPNEAAQAINDWASANTDNMIKGIVSEDDFNRDMLSVLANALFFDGKWKEAFDAGKTAKATFHGATTESTVDMMHGEFETTLRIHENYRSIELILGDDTFAMEFILPDGTSGDFPAYEKDGGSEVKTTVALWLPRFSYTTEGRLDLHDIFTAMGFEKMYAFGRMDMFAPAVAISDPQLDIYQKNSIEITESGAKATSVTAAEVGNGGPTELRFDRPFAFVLRDLQVGTILMAGRIAEL